jgi:hypothetical protein
VATRSATAAASRSGCYCDNATGESSSSATDGSTCTSVGPVLKS